MIPTPSERGPLEPIDPSRFDLEPIVFDLGKQAADADRQLRGPDREVENLASGIAEAGGEINLANEENSQAIGQVESDSDAIQENVNPPGSELDQAVAWTPFVDLQMDVAGFQVGSEGAAVEQAQPMAATSSPPPGASPQGVQESAAQLLRVATEDPPETS